MSPGFRLLPLIALLLALAVAGCAGGSSSEAPAADAQAEEEEPELAMHMSRLQRWTHKLALAARAQNAPLADFYLHELTEQVETIRAEVPTYEGYAIADLTGTYLEPRLAPLDSALDQRRWQQVRRHMDQLAASCNKCHEATEHGFIHISMDSLANPYLQNFAPQQP